MIMEDIVDSGDDPEIGQSDSISLCSSSTKSGSESNDEIGVDQLPPKQVRTRDGLAFWSNQLQQQL